MSLMEQLLAALPGTECGQCGHAGCRPYAEALAGGETQVDACAPGGSAGRVALSRILGLPAPVSLAEALAPFPASLVAKVDEAACIGCAKCLPACPVDAIVGASRQLHQVLTTACTGCGLCLPPCPVDCIQLDSRDQPSLPTLETPAAARILAAPGQACTQCGACQPVCPESLAPQAMYARLLALQAPAALLPELTACTRCGACDLACPSEIPLSAWFTQGRLIAEEADARLREGQRAANASARRQARTLKPAPRQSGFPDLARLDVVTAREELAGLLERGPGAADLPVGLP